MNRLLLAAALLSATAVSALESTDAPSASVHADAPTTSAAVPAASDAPIAQPATTRPTIYVKDLAHFSELVKEDNVVHPMALELVRKQRTATIVGLAGMGTGVALAVAAFFLPQDCSTSRLGTTCFPSDATPAVVGGGIGLTVVSGFVAVFMAPNRHDFFDAVNAWNTRHPAEPFNFGDHAVSR